MGPPTPSRGTSPASSETKPPATSEMVRPVRDQACPAAVVQPAPVLAVSQPNYVVQPVQVRSRYGLALRGC